MYVGANVRKLNLNFIKRHAQEILSATTISYLKDVQFRGSLFQDVAEAGVVSCLFTAFYVDHKEPLEAMKSWEDKQDMSWPLGVPLKATNSYTSPQIKGFSLYHILGSVSRSRATQAATISFRNQSLVTIFANSSPSPS